MRIQTLLLIVIAVFTSSASEAGAELDGFRLDPNVSPSYQEIELQLDASKTDYSGSVKIELNVAKRTTAFAFTAEEMSLDQVVLTGTSGNIDVELDETGEHGYVVATAEVPLEAGQYQLHIDFSKEYNTHAVGLYRTEYEGEGYLFTQFEAIDARKAFPCWDEPQYKIPYQLTLTIPAEQVAVTNTPIREESSRAGMKTMVFERTRPMPSYLIAMAVGNLESVPITGLSVPGRIYTVKGQSHLTEFAVETTPPILDALEQYFGRPYPYRKIDLIAVPEYWPGAMENPGAITYADNILLIDPRSAGVGQKRTLVRITAHELAHMWFGDLVTMAWWDDLWLNESFADWMGDKIAHQVYPQYEIELAQVRAIQGIYNRDAQASSVPIRKEVDSADKLMSGLMLAYLKGKTVLAMVEQWVGPDLFRTGVRNYVNDHEWGNAVGEDLWGALEAVSGKDVERVLSSFLDQPGYPLLSVTVEDEGTVVLKQVRYTKMGAHLPDQQWVFPVQLKYSTGGGIKTITTLLDRETKRLDLEGAVDWVVPNAGSYGYYRWEVPTAMLSELAAHPLDFLDARERSSFVANAGALLGAGRIPGGDFLATLRNISTVPEPEIVSAIGNALGGIRSQLITEEMEMAFAEYLQLTLAPALSRFGMEPVEGESEEVAVLRPQLLRLLGRHGGDERVRAYARKLADSYLDDPQSVDPQLAGTALGLAAIDGDREFFEACMSRFERAKIPAERARYLYGFSACSDPELQDAALEYAISGSVRPKETLSITGTIGSDEAGADKVYNWFVANYDAYTSLFPEPSKAYAPFFASGCSKERLDHAEEFFADPAHRVEGIDANMERVRDNVFDCINLRERELKSVAEYLRNLPSGGKAIGSSSHMPPGEN